MKETVVVTKKGLVFHIIGDRPLREGKLPIDEDDEISFVI